MDGGELSSPLPLSGPGAGARGWHRGVYLGDVLHAGQRSSGSCHQLLTCHTLSTGSAGHQWNETIWERGEITSVSVSRWWLSLVDNECYLLFTACWSRSSNCYSHEEWQVWPTLRQPLTVCQPGLRATEWEQGRDFSSLTRLPASLILGTLTVHWTLNMYSTVQHYLSYVLTEALICIIQFSWTNIGTLALAWVTYKFSFIKSSRKIGNG